MYVLALALSQPGQHTCCKLLPTAHTALCLVARLLCVCQEHRLACQVGKPD